jgi:hypothetical protein
MDRRGCRHHPSNPLTMDHIIPISSGSRSRIDELTILCGRCNTAKGSDIWPLESLAAEEREAPPDRRWAALVCADVHRRCYTCPEYGRSCRADQSRRLVPHSSACGRLRCPGTRTRMPDDSVAAVLALATGSGARTVPPTVAS